MQAWSTWRLRPGTLDLAIENNSAQPIRTPKPVTGGSQSSTTDRLKPPNPARGASASPSGAGSSFNDELNKLLQDDLNLGGYDGRMQLQNANNKKAPIAGRRAIATAGFANPSGATPVPSPSSAFASASSSMNPNLTLNRVTTVQSARGPRPRLGSHAVSATSGAYTARAAAKEAATLANAAPLMPPQREVSSDEDSDEDASPKINQVSSNAAAALYASRSSHTNHNGRSSSPQPTSSPSLPSVHSKLPNPPAASPHSSNSLHSPTGASGSGFAFPSASSSSTAAASTAASSTSSAAPAATDALPAEHYSGSIVAGGGIVGERDPNLKWANVDAFALATPKQKTSTALVLANYLTKSPATPHQIDKVRALHRWIAEFIAWVPTVVNNTGESQPVNGSGSPPPVRKRGVSEASALAKEEAKQAAEKKLELESDLRASKMRGVVHMDDDDDEETGGTSGPSIDVLTSVPEILRRRRASAEGLCNLFLELAESAGMECVKVSGYGKGCGLVKVAERFEAAHNHWWIACKLESQWMLLDLAWSSAYINQGKLDRQYSNSYFKPNPTIFALQHHPLQCHPGKRQPTKTIQEFVKFPEKLQLLEQPGTPAAVPGKKCITLAQFEQAMMIERGYLDLGVLMTHPLGVHTVRHDTPLYTISLQAPVSLEFIVGMNIPPKPKPEEGRPPPNRFVDQCWHCTYTPLQDDPLQQRVEIQFVFPWKGTFTITVRARRLTSKLLSYEDVVHYRFLVSCGLYDIRRERDVFVGFLARRIVVGSDIEFEHKFAVLRPLKGHFELNQPSRIAIAAPTTVTRMVAVNNGRWVELISTPSGQQSGPLKNRQIFEGDLKLLRYPDIQIHYKTKGQQFNLLYKYGMIEEGSGTKGSGSASSASAGAIANSNPQIMDDFDENKHGKIVLDSRGTCFEKRLRITQLKVGKRSCAISFETKQGTQVKAEVRAGWTSAQKINDKITVTQTGTRQAAVEAKCNCIPGPTPCQHQQAQAAAPQYDIATWDVTTQLSEAGDYSIHIFLSSTGSGVFRFALQLHLRMSDQNKAAGFNLDI